MAGPGKDDESMMWKMEELLQCMICFEAYRSPKMLQCAHTFCADCLIGYQKTYEQHRGAVAGKLPCPTCREFTVLPPTGVNGLRNDFKVQKMEDLFRTMYVRQQEQQKQRGTDNTACGPCQAQKKNRKAQSYCTDCSLSYCETCLAKHNRNTLFNNHKIVNVQSANISNLAAESLYCKKHRQEQGKYLCQTCHVIVCTVCIVNDHADHNVTEMTSVIRQQQRDVQNLRSVVQSKSDKLKNRLLELETLKQVNRTACQRSEAAINDKAKRTMDAVKEQQAALLEQLKHSLSERLSCIDSEIERVRYNINRTQAAGDYASSAASSVSVQMMALHDELIQRMKTVVDNDSASDDAGSLQSALSFVASNIQSDLLGRIELIAMSHEEISRQQAQQQLAAAAAAPSRAPAATRLQAEVRTASSDPVPNRVQAAAAAVNRVQPEIRVPSAKVQPEVVFDPPATVLQLNTSLLVESGRRPKLLMHIRQYGDKAGQLKDPLSIVWLPTGQLVVCEYGNKRLQVFDITGRSLGLIAAGQIGPQGVAMTLKGNIIVTDTLQKRLQVFTSDGQSLSKWGLGKFFSPCGVAVSPNGNCVVTDIGDNSVNVYRGEQTCLGRFGSKGSHDVQFDNPLYVATGAHNEIIVSDSNNHCIKVFDSAGQFVRKIGSEGTSTGQFKFPRGVYVTADGAVIVADRNNDRVSLFSMTGQFVRHLLQKEDGIRAPYAICVGPTGNLVLTESGNNRAAIKVFQL